MRLAAAVVTALAALPTTGWGQGTGSSTPSQTPAPKAENGTPSKPPPAAANDLARALLTPEQWGKVLDGYAGSLSGQVTQALAASGEKPPEDLRAKIRAELEKALPYQQTVKAQAEALSKELTPDELRKTANFYSSPLGKKVLERLPEAQSAAAQQLQGQLATAVPDIVNRLAPKALSSPHGGGGGAPGGSSPPAQGRRPPPTDGGTAR
jgi:hypothetical protein